MAEVRFETVAGAEDGGTFIAVPIDVPAVFGRARAGPRHGQRAHVRRHRDALVTEARRPQTRERRIGRVVEQVRGRA